MIFCRHWFATMLQPHGGESSVEALDTADDVNYRIHPGEPGGKANYFAIKLGLATLNGELPYDHRKWWYNSTASERPACPM